MQQRSQQLSSCFEVCDPESEADSAYVYRWLVVGGIVERALPSETDERQQRRGGILNSLPRSPRSNVEHYDGNLPGYLVDRKDSPGRVIRTKEVIPSVPGAYEIRMGN